VNNTSSSANNLTNSTGGSNSSGVINLKPDGPKNN
jgi:hypothetical protein